MVGYSPWGCKELDTTEQFICMPLQYFSDYSRNYIMHLSVQFSCSVVPDSESHADPWTAARQASLVTQMLKNLPAMSEIQVQSLGREDPLEKEMAIHSSILALEISLTEGPGGLQPRAGRDLDMT